MEYKEKFGYKITQSRVIEEVQNQHTDLAMVEWGADATGEKARLEIRRWRNQPDGTDFPLKGCTFMTEEGPHNLTSALLEMGYGNTKDCLQTLSTRSDFKKSLNSVLGKDSEFYDEEAGTLEDDYLDPKALLGL